MDARDALYKWLPDQGAATGGPGITPRWTSSKKDSVCTAYSAASRVWFTISHGTLNEIYFPTIDRPQTRDMELLFTDGETFVHEEKRDFEYDFHYIDPDALAVRVVASDLGGRYTVTKDFISDPHHPVVLMRVRLEGDEEVLRRMKCYALLAPHLDGGGAGNSARAVEVAGQRVVLAWKNNMHVTMGTNVGFTRTSCGFAGTTDGFRDLKQDMKMDHQFGEALDGNLALTGEIDLSKNREFTLALSFGEGPHAALSGMMQSLSVPFDLHLKRFIEQWHRAATPERLCAASMDKGRLMRISHNVILAHEDKIFPGAFIASASIPWGNAKGDDDLGGYHLVWTRDMIQSATALLACGRTDTARRALVYLACTQRPDGSFAQNFWIDGTPYWTGIQLDEVAFPIMLAWRLWKVGGLGNFEVFPFVEQAAAFLVQYAPITQQERWEEASGYSPSTLATVIAALLCAADIAKSHPAPELATFLQSYADWIEEHLDEWTTTSNGVLLPEVKRHYVRICPPNPGEPFYNPEAGPGRYNIANRAPGEQFNFAANEVVDAGFLELVRYGVRRADDPLIVDSLKVIDHVLKISTPYGPCWRRYNHDGYGQQKDGEPFVHYGQGRAWPILTGERAHYELAAGGEYKPLVQAMERFSSFGGMLPEQVWDYKDMPSKGLFFGRSAGSAQPLVWAHAEYVKLLRSGVDGTVFDRIAVVEERYGVPRNERTWRSEVEFFKVARPIKHLPAGKRLHVLDRDYFEVHWTVDGWETQNCTRSELMGYPGFAAEMPLPSGFVGELELTLHWPSTDRWVGHNFTLEVTSSQT